MNDIDPNEPRAWKPGDIANGHMLGNDGVWRLIPPAQPKKPGAGWKIFWIITALGTGLGAFAAIGSALGIIEPSDSDSSSGVRYACEQWVKDQLRAPSTADFTDGGITHTGDHRWVVTGMVDAQNGFGAQIRTSWTCSVETTDDGFRGHATLVP